MRGHIQSFHQQVNAAVRLAVEAVVMFFSENSVNAGLGLTRVVGSMCRVYTKPHFFVYTKK